MEQWHQLEVCSKVSRFELVCINCHTMRENIQETKIKSPRFTHRSLDLININQVLTNLFDKLINRSLINIAQEIWLKAIVYMNDLYKKNRSSRSKITHRTKGKTMLIRKRKVESLKQKKWKLNTKRLDQLVLWKNL